MVWSSGESNPPRRDDSFLDTAFVSERTLALCGTALREMYDELFELNFTQDTYRVLFVRQGKYMGSPHQGVLSSELVRISENLIYPADRGLFLAFFDVRRIYAELAAGARSLTVEFRQRRVDTRYEWVQASLLPAGDDAAVWFCCILDIHQRKLMEQNNAMMQEICRVAVTSEYEFLCLVQVSTRTYTTFKFEDAVESLEQQGDYDTLIRQMSVDAGEEDRQMFLDSLLLDHVLEALEDGHPEHVVIHRVKRNGAWRWHSARFSYFRNNPDMILCTVRNITDVYEVREQHSHLQQQFLHVFGSIYTDIVELDPHAGTGMVMKSQLAPHMESSVRTFEILADFFLRQRVHADDWQVIAESVSKKSLCNFLQSNTGKKTFEVRYQTSEDRYEWMELSLFTIEVKTHIAKKALLTACNVNDRKLLKQISDRFIYQKYDYLVRIDANDDKYTVISNNSELPITTIDIDYNQSVVLYNSMCVVPEELECLNKSMMLDVVVEHLESNDEYNIFASTVGNGTLQRKRIQYVYIDRKRKQILMTCMDITDVYEEEQRKNAILRQALHQAETASRAKTDFLSRMSHDIRTPMNAIIGMTSIALKRFEHRERVKDCLHKIEISSKYLLSLLNDVLDMARIESGAMVITPSPFDFADFVRGFLPIVQQQADAKQIAFAVGISSSIGKTYVGDMLRLSQVVLNLVSNAIKYTPEGGRVDVCLREIARHDRTATLEMEIRDTGCGMSAAFMEHMFEPFEQESSEIARNQVGTGLGLPIVHHLVRLMEGTLHVHSEVGQGTEFVVTIPLELVHDRTNVLQPNSLQPDTLQPDILQVDDHAGEGFAPDVVQAAVSAQHPTVFAGQRILVVEDNDINMDITCELLKHMELTVEQAEHGQQAVDMFGSAPSGWYTAIFMDIRMPVMDGIEATRAIRILDHPDARTVPIIGLSANVFQEDVRTALDAGMNGYLIKPIDVHALRTALEEQIWPPSNTPPAHP